MYYLTPKHRLYILGEAFIPTINFLSKNFKTEDIEFLKPKILNFYSFMYIACNGHVFTTLTCIISRAVCDAHDASLLTHVDEEGKQTLLTDFLKSDGIEAAWLGLRKDRTEVYT